MPDYYKVLGVAENANAKELKKAYRNLSKKYHPDLNHGDTASEERFKEINEAYTTLSDNRKRQEYDMRRAPGPFHRQGGHPFSGGINLDSLFSDFFSQGFQARVNNNAHNRAKKPSAQKPTTHNSDTLINFRIPFKKLKSSKDIKSHIKINEEHRCGECGGVGGDERIECDPCSGTGMVQELFNQSNVIMNTVRPCENCHGRGNAIANVCETCNGDGVVILRKKYTITLNCVESK